MSMDGKKSQKYKQAAIVCGFFLSIPTLSVDALSVCLQRLLSILYGLLCVAFKFYSHTH